MQAEGDTLVLYRDKTKWYNEENVKRRGAQ